MSEPNKPTTVPSVDDIVLLPCPFCGGKAFYVGFDVICETEDCFASEGTAVAYESKEEAIEAWNRRSICASAIDAARIIAMLKDGLESLKEGANHPWASKGRFKFD